MVFHNAGSGLSSGGGALHTFLLSGAMAFVYQTHVIFWARDVLMFPNRKLHRLGRFREQVPVVLKRMVPVGGVTVIFHHVLMRVAGIGGPGILQTILNFMVVTFCLTLWSLGASLVEIIFSERLRLGDYDSKDVMDTMYECVDCQKGDLMYILALHDLSLLPSDANKAAWRRRQIFSDDSGILWNKFSSICMDILTGVILDIEKIGKDPKDYNKKKTMDASGAHGTRWNSYPATGNISKVRHLYRLGMIHAIRNKKNGMKNVIPRYSAAIPCSRFDSKRTVGCDCRFHRGHRQRH